MPFMMKRLLLALTVLCVAGTCDIPSILYAQDASGDKNFGPPKPATDLQPGTRTYAVHIALGEQKMDTDSTTEIKDEDGHWVVTETLNTPGGAVVDRGVLEKGTLILRKRTITQGPLSIDFDSRDGKLKGEMKMGGQPRPISMDAGGELFADGPGALEVIAALPLAEGYSTRFRNFDAQTQQLKIVQIKVLGSESVTVAAGTFATFKVDVDMTGGATATAWIAKDSHRAVKAIATLPQMNGAVLTMELQK